MDDFGNIINTAKNEAAQTYASDTAAANNAQQQANQQLGNVNSEGQIVNQNAAKLSGLGDQYADMGNVTKMYNQDEQQQLGQMGFDKNTLNQANQNIAQETGQLGAANNQIASQGGTRGFNAVGTQNKQANIQNQVSNAVNANSQVQSNELGQANAASTYTGQEIGAQQTSQQNAIQAYNDAATQTNGAMANYATTLNTLANQATTYGGLVGSNVANIMASAKSAADALLDKSQNALNLAQANQANASAALTRQQIEYNNQMNPLRIQAQKMVNQNNANTTKQIDTLTKEINGEQSQLQAKEESENAPYSGGGIINTLGRLNPFFSIFHNASDASLNSGLTNEISAQQSELNSLRSGQAGLVGQPS